MEGSKMSHDMKKEYREIYKELYTVYYHLRKLNIDEKIIRKIHIIQNNVGKLLENDTPVAIEDIVDGKFKNVSTDN
jgi:hypothetical protein